MKSDSDNDIDDGMRTPFHGLIVKIYLRLAEIRKSSVILLKVVVLENDGLAPKSELNWSLGLLQIVKPWFTTIRRKLMSSETKRHKKIGLHSGVDLYDLG